MSNPYDLPAAQLLANFRAWEERGRGWQLFSHPVELEPPFRPFHGHFVWRPPQIDDGRRPGGFFNLFKSTSAQKLPPGPAGSNIGVPEPEPRPGATRRHIRELQVLLPPEFALHTDADEQLLLTSSFTGAPVSVELIGRPDAVSFQIVCDSNDSPHIQHQLATLAPDGAVISRDGFLAGTWDETPGVGVVVDLGLGSEFMRPLCGSRPRKAETLSPLVAALADVGSGECAVVQILFCPAREPWAESILRAVVGNDGEPLFAEAPGEELVRAAEEKVSRRLFACRARIAAKSPTRGRSISLVRSLLSGVGQVPSARGNELIGLDPAGWSEAAQHQDLLERTAHRTGMLLNADELSALVHLPGPGVQHPKFARLTTRTRAAPALARTDGLLLGRNEHLGETVEVRLTPSQRLRHTYVVGGTGTGKSTLLLSMILQDIAEGRGVAVLDPHGDLVDEVLGRMPLARLDDMVLFDPADEEYPVGFNLLAAHSDLERTLLASDLVAIFRRLSTSWGDQMNSVFANAILAFLESSTGGTLLELRRFLVDREYRTTFLQTVSDPEVVFYWQKEFPLLKGNPQAPILTRLDSFLRPRIIRNIVGQREQSLSFEKLLNGGYIFLARLSHGAIGEENAHLLGAILVSKFHQVALARQAKDERDRQDFFLYADEFHNFQTPSMTALLSGVRKYHLGLTLAHQDLRQLGGPSDELLSSVFGNVATRVVFRVGDRDARTLAEGFSHFEAQDLQSLGVGEAIARVERADFDFNLRTEQLPPVDPEQARAQREEAVSLSREQYAARRADVSPNTELATPTPAPVPTPAPRQIQVSGTTPTLPERAPRLRKAKDGDVAAPATPGRGGQQHKYLQSLIRRFAEDRGYRVEIEKRVLDSAGIVDVALEREGVSVAVEISVTTTLDHELGNVQKCIAAGFDHVVLILTDKRALGKARQAVSAALPEADRARVQVASPEEVVGILDQLSTAPVEAEQTVGGYKVSVKLKAVGEAETARRKQTLSGIVSSTIQRLKPRS